MADDAKKDLEQQLREQLEREMEDRQAARQKQAAQGKADARNALEEELQREIEQQINQAPNPSNTPAPKPPVDADVASKLEDEIQRELQARLTDKSQPDASPAKSPSARRRPTATEVKAVPIDKKPDTETEAQPNIPAAKPEAVAVAAPAPATNSIPVAKPEAPAASIPVAKPEAPAASIPVAKPDAPAAPAPAPKPQTPAPEAIPDDGSEDAQPNENGAGVSVKVVDPEEGEAQPAKSPVAVQTDGKRASTRTRANPNRKTQRRPKKVGGTRARNKTSNTRNLSDQEQKLLEEKAKIDAKFKKQQRYLYVGITAGTLLAAAILLPLAFKLRGCIHGSPEEPKVTVKQKPHELPSHITGSHTSKRPKTVAKLEPVATMGELQSKVREELRKFNHQVAVDYLEQFMRDKPNYAPQCKTRIKEIAEQYVTDSIGSTRWQEQQGRIARGMFSNDPGDIRSAISSLKSFGRGSRTERFAANYYINLMTERHVELTGGLLPY